MSKRYKIVNFDEIPSWFPKTKFNDYICDYLTSRNLTETQENLFFYDVSNRINNLGFIKNFQISRVRHKHLKMFSSIHSWGKTRNSHIPSNFDVNVSNFGFDFKFGESRGINTIECLLSYYLFKSGSVSINFTRPFLKYPNFSNQSIFPFYSFKFLFDSRKVYEQLFLSKGFETSITDSKKSISLTFLLKNINCILSDNNNSFFDRECYPFSNISLRFNHNFELNCNHIFIPKVTTKILIEPTFIFNQRNGDILDTKNFPLLIGKFETKVNFPFNATIHLDSGIIFSEYQIPFCKRFHIGGIPTMRGILYGDFAPKVDDIPCGSDAYFAFGIDQAFPFYTYQSRLQWHVFLNTGISKLSNRKSSINRNMFEISGSDFTSFMSSGVGFICKIMGRTFEANIAFPVSLSPNMKLMMFQVGIDPSSSEKE
ncbi:hypothetical protein M9Y10_034679 [Tritrichomonas musculus]|uniref:Bacterial surface antigen (D15) domain-containing protein n=1 Tax=Tritrichomonas musculus TaxID=1915356 RepID=A0ABR2KFS4_9EUKA